LSFHFSKLFGSASDQELIDSHQLGAGGIGFVVPFLGIRLVRFVSHDSQYSA
jgi:hypothetical protein